jgi:hypothetical protein
MSPVTLAGLPYGNKAVLTQVEGNTGGLVLFIDGEKACTPCGRKSGGVLHQRS